MLKQNGQDILVTVSYQQLQARLLKDPTLDPVMIPPNSTEATAINLY